MPVRVQLNYRGIGQILRSSEFVSEMNARANRAAANVRRTHPDADVVVESYTTDRGAAAVVVRDHRAMGWQARDGILTRAAAAAGLPFSPPKR